MQPRTRDLLEDIREELSFVFEETNGLSLEAYVSDRRLRRSVERSFEIIGEAVRRLRDRDPEIANRLSGRGKIIAFRNVLSHGYDVIDQAEVWDIIQSQAPVLQDEVEALLNENPEPSDGVS